MNIKYLVASPGRTGSIFVAHTIAQSLGYKVVFDNNLLITPAPKNNIPVIYHSHDVTLQFDEDIIVIQPYRKNIFNAIVSAVISEEYREWNNYTGNKQPFVADLEIFKEQYIWHRYWDKMFTRSTKYNNRINLCFDDFIGDSQKVCLSLNIPLTSYTSIISPYKNNVLNITELEEYYKQLEQEFTADIPELFKEINSKKIIKNTYEQK
jgi:hypothetical protein